MKNSCINISIFGLGLTTTEEIKIVFRQNLQEKIGINWTNITDTHLDCLLINEIFFENENVQKIIREKKIPYLKVSKKLDDESQDNHLYLYLPLTDLAPLKHLISSHLMHKVTTLSLKDEPPNFPKPLLFFTDIYKQDHRKIHITDQFGTLAIIDHHAHFTWLEPSREQIKTDHSISYKTARTSDFIKISRKRQLNLENWIFLLIWNSEDLIEAADTNLYYRIGYWPQPSSESRKTILQLSASFSLGADIKTVANRLDIHIETVQRFIAANQAINNIQIISPKESLFGQSTTDNTINKQEAGILTGFFKKLKRRFGF